MESVPVGRGCWRAYRGAIEATKRQSGSCQGERVRRQRLLESVSRSDRGYESAVLNVPWRACQEAEAAASVSGDRGCWRAYRWAIEATGRQCGTCRVESVSLSDRGYEMAERIMPMESVLTSRGYWRAC